MYEIPDKLLTQGTASPTSETTEPEIECSTPATTTQQTTLQDIDWPDAIPVQILSLIDQPEDQGIDRHQTQCNSDRAKIPDLEENSKEEQFTNLDSYLVHHNTYEASQYIHQQYRSHLHALDKDQYYAEIDRSYHSYDIPAAQDYWPANQAPEPCRTMEELKRVEKAEDKHAEKNCMGTDHLAQELGHYKVTFSAKLKRTRDYDKGTPIFINFYVIGSTMSMLKYARYA